MGDEGRLYIAPALVEAYKRVIVPLASIMVPNQFEAELLADMKIGSVEDGFLLCAQLHQRGPHTVVRGAGGVEGCRPAVA